MKVTRTDDLLIKLDQHLQDEIEETETKPRTFFRGSEIGNCSNQINFRRRGTPIPRIGANKARFLDDGRLHQSVISMELQKAGIKVKGEEKEKTFKFTIQGIPIKIVSHKDGEVNNRLLEVKSVKEERFSEILKTGDVSAYYDQTQGYMTFYGYDKCYLIVIDRNNSLRQEFTIDRDPHRVKHLFKKLYHIEKNLQEGVQSTRDYPRTSKECGWCPYYEPCWGVKKGVWVKGERQEKAVEIEGKKETKTWELAIDLYRKYTRLKEESKQYREESQGLMEILFKKFKATRLHGKDGAVTRVVSTRSTPDKTAIRELIAKGVIPVNNQEIISLRYSINGDDEGEDE